MVEASALACLALALALPPVLEGARMNLTPGLDYCPVCSRLKANHRELLEDVLVTPTVLHSAPQKDRRYRDGRFRVIGCPHVSKAFGAHDSEAVARQAIQDTFRLLREQRQAEAKRLDALLSTI